MEKKEQTERIYELSLKTMEDSLKMPLDEEISNKLIKLLSLKIKIATQYFKELNLQKRSGISQLIRITKMYPKDNAFFKSILKKQMKHFS